MNRLVKELICLLLVTLSSCEKITEIRLPEKNPILIMNAYISTADSLHTVYVGKGLRDTTEALSDAKLECYINGSKVDEHSESGTIDKIVFNAKIEAGDILLLRLSSSGLGDCKSEVRFPEATAIEKVSLKKIEYKGQTRNMVITEFSDSPSDGENYRIQLFSHSTYYYDTPDEKSPGSIGTLYKDKYQALETDNTIEPLLYSGENLPIGFLASGDEYFANKQNIMKDDDINGRKVNIKLIARTPIAAPFDANNTVSDSLILITKLIVRLSTFENTAYDFYKATYFYNSSLTQLYSEPYVKIPSNVEGGLGYIVALSSFEYNLKFEKKISANESWTWYTFI